MKIEEYEFGYIIIDGKKYQKDLIITPNGIIENWWRKEGHKVCWDDIKFLNFENIKYLIIGTGWAGVMKVSKDLEEKMQELNIKIIALDSKKAVKEYISLKEGSILAIHLTC